MLQVSPTKQPFTNEQIINITHTDLDGCASAMVVSRAFPSYHVGIFSTGYNSISNLIRSKITQLQAAKEVIFTDISPTEYDIEYLKNANVNFSIYDHHDTAKHLHNGENIIVNLDDSGTITTLTGLVTRELSDLKTFSPTFMNFLITVDAWDMHRTDHSCWEKAEDLALYFGFVGFKNFFLENNYNPFTFEGPDPKTLEYLKDQRDRYLSRTSFITEEYKAGKYTIGIIFTCEFTSDYAHEVLKEYDIAFIINPNRNAISVRTEKEDINLGEICSKFKQGGGHPQAAGISYEGIFEFGEILAQFTEYAKEYK